MTVPGGPGESFVRVLSLHHRDVKFDEHLPSDCVVCAESSCEWAFNATRRWLVCRGDTEDAGPVAIAEWRCGSPTRAAVHTRWTTAYRVCRSGCCYSCQGGYGTRAAHLQKGTVLLPSLRGGCCESGPHIGMIIFRVCVCVSHSTQLATLMRGNVRLETRGRHTVFSVEIPLPSDSEPGPAASGGDSGVTSPYSRANHAATATGTGSTPTSAYAFPESPTKTMTGPLRSPRAASDAYRDAAAAVTSLPVSPSDTPLSLSNLKLVQVRGGSQRGQTPHGHDDAVVTVEDLDVPVHISEHEASTGPPGSDRRNPSEVQLQMEGVSSPPSAGTGSVARPPSAQVAGLRCLVVDDELVNRRLCARMLAKLGCTCEVLEDGDEVVGRLLRGRAPGSRVPVDARLEFDVILLDIMMRRTNVRPSLCSRVYSCACVGLLCALAGGGRPPSPPLLRGHIPPAPRGCHDGEYVSAGSGDVRV